MSGLVWMVMKAMIVLPIWGFVAYQNKHHTRSYWDIEEAAVPVQSDKKTKD